MKEGVAIERFGIEPNGHINLVGPERLGRARLYWEAPGVARAGGRSWPAKSTS